MAPAKSARCGAWARAGRRSAPPSAGDASCPVARSGSDWSRCGKARCAARIARRSARARAKRPTASPGGDPRHPQPSRGCGSNGAVAPPGRGLRVRETPPRLQRARGKAFARPRPHPRTAFPSPRASKPASWSARPRAGRTSRRSRGVGASGASARARLRSPSPRSGLRSPRLAAALLVMGHPRHRAAPVATRRAGPGAYRPPNRSAAPDRRHMTSTLGSLVTAPSRIGELLLVDHEVARRREQRRQGRIGLVDGSRASDPVADAGVPRRQELLCRLSPVSRHKELEPHGAAPLRGALAFGEANQLAADADSAVSPVRGQHPELAGVLVETLDTDAADDPAAQAGDGDLAGAGQLSNLARRSAGSLFDPEPVLGHGVDIVDQIGDPLHELRVVARGRRELLNLDRPPRFPSARLTIHHQQRPRLSRPLLEAGPQGEPPRGSRRPWQTPASSPAPSSRAERPFDPASGT